MREMKIICYSVSCFLIRQFRISKHTIEFKITGDIRYQYEIDHYKEMKTFSRIGKISNPKTN